MVLYCLFWCQSFGDVSLYVCSYYFYFGSVAEWPPFGKKLLTRLTICSLRILTICNIRLVFPVLVFRAEFGF